LRAELFKVCPAHRKNEKKRTNNETFKTKGYQKPTQQSNSFSKKAMENNAIDQNLHHFE
jgi:hypothetical protein